MKTQKDFINETIATLPVRHGTRTQWVYREHSIDGNFDGLGVPFFMTEGPAAYDQDKDYIVSDTLASAIQIIDAFEAGKSVGVR